MFLTSLWSKRLVVVAVFAIMSACGDDNNPPAGPEATPAAVVATRLEGVPYPADNAPSPAKVGLGRMLDWDPILSGNRDVACASCHDPALGYGDGRAISRGTTGLATKRGVFAIYRRIDERADPLFRNLRAPDDRDAADVVAFLQSASDGDFDATVPDAVPSGLPVGGRRADGRAVLAP